LPTGGDLIGKFPKTITQESIKDVEHIRWFWFGFKTHLNEYGICTAPQKIKK